MTKQPHPTPPKEPQLPRQAIAQELRSFLNSQKTMAIASGIVVLALAGIAFGFTQGQTQENTTDTSKAKSKNEPQYTTLLPEATSIKQLGGWVRVSPPGKSAVYAFQDSIKKTAISVTQQPLPTAFKTDPDSKLAELAKSYNATNKLKADKTVFYTGISAKGPQSVLFVKDDVLVLIKSEKKVSDKDWSTYIKLLKDPKRSAIPKF